MSYFKSEIINIRKSNAKVRDIIKLAAPNYRRHKAIVTEGPESVECTGTYWSGGSRKYYMRVRLATREVFHINAPLDPPQFGGGKAPRVAIPEGEYVVELGTFNGKTAAAHVYGKGLL